MPVQPLEIDIVSDVACPWCAIGLSSLQQALARVGDDVEARVVMHPFETAADALLKRFEIRQALKRGEKPIAHYGQACYGKYGPCDMYDYCRAGSNTERRQILEDQFRVDPKRARGLSER